MHPRSTAVVISSIYLFGPAVFSTSLVPIQPPTNNLTVESIELGDMVNGKGGPIEELLFTQREPLPQSEYLKLEQKVPLVFGVEEVQGPIVKEMRTLNYLKVANTTMPVTDPKVSSDYGWRTAPCGGCSSDHQGVDFTPGVGTPVFAITDGMVIEMGTNGGYGYYVVLKHLVANKEGVIEEWVSLYAHLKKDSFPVGLKIGSVVKTGDTIGAVGSTGQSTGPHLHFELKINGENVDPLPLLGTYEVLIVSEEEYPDYMFVGETFKVVETEVTYE